MSETQTLHFLVSCECHDTPDFTQMAYKILCDSILKEEPKNLEVIHKEKDVVGLVNQLADLPDKSANKALQAIINSDKFAVYMVIDSTGAIKQLWNILTGRKIPWVS